MESFPLIKSSLERLLHELPSPRHNSLQQELKTQLINAIHHFPAAPLSPDHPLFGKNNPADHYWPALKLACHSSNIARVREVALDSIQKLIAHNLLRGSLPLDPAQAEAIFPAASPASASTPALATPIVKRPPAGDNDLSHLAGYATPPVVGSPLPVHKKLSIVQSPTSGPPPSLQATPSPTPSSPPPAGAIPAPAPAEGSAQVLPTAAQKYQIDDIVHTVCTSFTGPQTEEPIQLQILKVLLTTVTSTTCEVHELSLLKAVQTCFNIYLYSKNQTNQITAKASLTQMLHIVFSRMENYAQVLTESAQAIPDLLVLIRQSLCISISRNAITTNPMLFELSLSIFLLVIRFYRSQLKVEIESLLKCVYIHILEMGNSTYKQKSMVLQGLLKICESPQTLTDLYINYDCDLAMTSIFETIINACARVAQGRDVGAAEGSGSSAATSSSTTSTSRGGLIGFAASAAGLDTKADLIRAQEKRIRLRGLCCLMAVVNSLVDWCQELDPSIPLVGSGGKIRPNSASTAASVPPADSSQRLSISSNVSDANRARSGSEVSEQPSRLVAQPRPSIAVDADGSKPKTFQEALAPENQANPYIVKRHPLQTVSMAHQAATQLYANNPSVTSLTSSSNIDSLTLRKQLMKQCITLFNQKPEKGIDMLVEHGFVERDPVSIARLLHSTSELSKSAIGDYLGEGDAFNVKTMHAFVDYLDFEDMDFVSALRQFLQSFRLPGEAQKISRYMEKFADRYCETNPQVFAKADTAYTLSYSIIMLNVDQHSEKIKVRMDKAAFIKNNRGINDGADLSDEYLSSIFDNISGNEIILEEEHAGQINAMAIGLGAGDLNDRQRMELYRKEIAIEEEAEFQANATPKVTDLCLQGFAGSIRIASLFKMETERDAFVTSLCKLTGLTHVVDLNSKNIKAVKTLIALANSLGEYLESSWTQILKIVSQLERLQSGSVLGHATLPTSASTGGGLMNLARKSISGESRKMDASGAPGGFNPAAEGYGLATASGKPNPALEKMIVELQQQSLIVAVDRIFSSTTKLSVTALVHFFRCLCIVSAEEVGLESTQASASSQPAMTVALVGPLRMYLLQKIVEISYYNVNRIRFEWTQIWKILQPHFNALACHSSNQVAVFAIDSLRQLNMKFLEREELGHYSTQSEFLKSFEYIVKYNPRHNIRELIVSTLSQMIHLRASSIRSGWKTIFVVFSRSISKDEERLITLSFETLQSVYLSYFDYVVLAPGAYVDYVACLAEFVLLPGVGKIHEEVVLGSTDLLQQCLERLVHLAQEGKDISPAHTHQAAASAIANKQRKSSVRSISGDYQHLVTPNASSTRTPSQPYFNANGTISEEHFFLKWFPVLTTLTRIITDSTSGQVRTKTTDILFDTLKNSGEYFEPSFWKKIHRGVLLPIFEDLRETKAQGSNGSARNSVAVVSREANYAVWIYGLRMLVDLYSIYFDALMGQQDKGVIKSTFELINSMMCRKDEKLSTTGQICLNQLLRTNIGKLPRLQQADGGRTDSWELITSCLEECFRQTTPAELLNCVYPSKSGVMVQSSQSSLDPDDSRETIDTPSHPRESIGASQNGATTIQGRTQLQSLELTQQRGNRVAIEAADVNGGIGIPLSALDFGHTIIKCSIHLELIQSIRDIALSPILNVNEDTHGMYNSANPDVFINLIPATFRSRWIGVMYNSYCFARTFNANVELRHALLRSGLISNLPNLTKQETISESTYIRMLFAVYRFCGDDDGEGTEILNSLVGESMDVMQRFADMVADQSKFKRDITMWSSVVIIIFQELLATKQKCHWRSSMTVDVAPGEDHMRPAESGLRLKALLPEVYRVAIECIAIDNADVRVALVEFMRGTIDLFVLH
ncbi:uncharacterized protein BJ171DRAFT_423031 [Polychytrium aggregatum]|uniref:uncharacterized protein n=1 Tax=Polychytrium aggregatum TaxID=110093 RepID=UPI0022FE594D|nr:uncharacterized protein BJ171DRAFT_423031 [Polychytrium aggregatum]KAI9205577.1 hypothetical protein BJ171DRAFT_423031 [Polychytrium aggregatum]